MSFITNDQKAAIGGEGSFSFVTTIGSGIEKVDVTMSYEYDYEGIFNTCIESVTFQGVDVCGCLSEETLSALEMEAIAKHETQLKDDYYA